MRVGERYQASSACAGERLTVLGNSFDVVHRSGAVFGRHYLAQHQSALAPVCPHSADRRTDRNGCQPCRGSRICPSVIPALPVQLSPTEVTCASLAPSSLVNRIGVYSDKATSFSQSDERISLGQGAETVAAPDKKDTWAYQNFIYLGSY